MDSIEELVESGDVVALVDRAESGDAMACLILGRMYGSGDGLPADAAMSEEMYARAARCGDAEVVRLLGAMYLNGDCAPADPARAAGLLRASAAMGDPLSQFYIGQMYREGIGVPPSASEAEMWLSRAARNGIRRAASVRRGRAPARRSDAIPEGNGGRSRIRFYMRAHWTRTGMEWKSYCWF